MVRNGVEPLLRARAVATSSTKASAWAATSRSHAFPTAESGRDTAGRVASAALGAEGEFALVHPFAASGGGRLAVFGRCIDTLIDRRFRPAGVAD
ncbi:hypothetical protein [Natrialba sp. PRR66]|uniref:hypothetical protein n=1 Tax=Natrialba sp. PRR66 TaxID=3098146 RepID=UPI002B1D4D7A|nr:hypothetical protein [Natrialba sp. PRR66]